MSDRNIIEHTTDVNDPIFATHSNVDSICGIISNALLYKAKATFYLVVCEFGGFSICINNLLNLTTLASNIQGLKGQTNKGVFYKDFAAGLILGSNNLVNETNSTNVMNGLTNLVNNVDLSALTAKANTAAEKVTETVATTAVKADTAIANATEIATSVSNILNLFKK